VLVTGCIVACAAAATFSVLVLLHAVDTLDMSAGYGIPIGYSRQAGEMAREALPSGGQVLIGDDPQHGEVMRFTVGYKTPSRTFDDCQGVPYMSNAVYLLSSEQTPGAQLLDSSGAPLLARIARPGGDAFRIYGPPREAGELNSLPDSNQNQLCQDRLVWDNP
jgi:hypothetical protein